MRFRFGGMVTFGWLAAVRLAWSGVFARGHVQVRYLPSLMNHFARPVVDLKVMQVAPVQRDYRGSTKLRTCQLPLIYRKYFSFLARRAML